eukprot:13628089-Alexandrium_andersonii.AAC.1
MARESKSATASLRRHLSSRSRPYGPRTGFQTCAVSEAGTCNGGGQQSSAWGTASGSGIGGRA